LFRYAEGFIVEANGKRQAARPVASGKRQAASNGNSNLLKKVKALKMDSRRVTTLDGKG